MTADEINNVAIPHLAGQFERGLPILFTGSGFSTCAKNVAGQAVPLVTDLKRSMWDICFPGKDFLESVSLQELFEYALIRHRPDLTNLLTTSFTVDAETIPEWYARVYGLSGPIL